MSDCTSFRKILIEDKTGANKFCNGEELADKADMTKNISTVLVFLVRLFKFKKSLQIKASYDSRNIDSSTAINTLS